MSATISANSKVFFNKIEGRYDCDYSHAIYTANKKPITVVCNEHKCSYNITPANHLKHKGCPMCRKEGYGQHLKIDIKEFIEKAVSMHSNLYNYDKVIYKGYNYPVEIVCKKHGSFHQLVKNHLAGSGCPDCANDQSGKHNILNENSKIQFFDKCRLKHGDFYDYSKSDFTKVFDRMNIGCPIHGEFSQVAHYHRKGNGCPKCGQESIDRASRMSVEEFTKRGKDLFGDRYDYSKVHTFKNNKERVIIGCNTCKKEFTQLVEVHTRNHGCPICGIKSSKWETEIVDFLTENGLNDICKSRSVIGNLELDIYSKSYNLAIECNGNYWHSEIAGNKRPMYHLHKTMKCKEVGVNLIHIFEDEWLYKKDIVKSVLLNRFKLTKHTLYARKCEVREISSKDKSIFLANNHMFGSAPATVKLGLYHDNTLVSVMSFTKHNIHQWELNRFSNLLNYNIVGGASKLFSFFTKHYNPKSVISLADLRWSNGHLYRVLGFVEKQKRIRPTYYYTKNYLIREHKMNYRKSKLRSKLSNYDSGKSEKDNMFAHKYDRIWDCGHLTFIWNSGNMVPE